jgi:hypothetical protein
VQIPQENSPGFGAARGPETGFETISLRLNNHTGRGVGGRQYGTSEDIETLPRPEQYRATIDVSRRGPLIDGTFRPRWNRNCTDVLSFANQVSDYPVLLADLEIFRSESNQFGPSQAASKEQRQNRPIAFASGAVWWLRWRAFTTRLPLTSRRRPRSKTGVDCSDRRLHCEDGAVPVRLGADEGRAVGQSNPARRRLSGCLCHFAETAPSYASPAFS